VIPTIREQLTILDTLCHFINDTFPAILLACFGGAVNMLNNKGSTFTWRWFFIGIFTAGFVGLVMDALLCGYGVSSHVRTAALAISGYSANDMLKVLREKLLKKVIDHE